MSNTTSKTQDDLRTMFYRASDMFNEAEDRDEDLSSDDLVKVFEDEGHDMAEVGRYLLSGFLEGEVHRGVVHAAHEVQTFRPRS